MDYRLVVAAVASWLPRFEPPVGGNDLDRRYGERLKIAVTISPRQTLGEVYRLAVDGMNARAVRGTDGYVEDPLDAVYWAWCYEPGDADGISRDKAWELAEHLITVDERGLARWQRPASAIPYGDLVRAAEHGLLRGDPLRPYLVLLLPQGPDVLHVAWRELVLLWQLIGHLLTGRELLKIARGRRERLQQAAGAATVMTRHSAAWSKRGGGPPELLATLERRPWTPDDLRMLLGVATADEAIALLEAFGFVRNRDGEYELGTDEESRLLRQIADEASRGRLDPEDAELHVEERVRAAIDTGNLPPWTPF